MKAKVAICCAGLMIPVLPGYSWAEDSQRFTEGFFSDLAIDDEKSVTPRLVLPVNWSDRVRSSISVRNREDATIRGIELPGQEEASLNATSLKERRFQLGVISVRFGPSDRHLRLGVDYEHIVIEAEDGGFFTNPDENISRFLQDRDITVSRWAIPVQGQFESDWAINRLSVTPFIKSELELDQTIDIEPGPSAASLNFEDDQSIAYEVVWDGQLNLTPDWAIPVTPGWRFNYEYLPLEYDVLQVSSDFTSYEANVRDEEQKRLGAELRLTLGPFGSSDPAPYIGYRWEETRLSVNFPDGGTERSKEQVHQLLLGMESRF